MNHAEHRFVYRATVDMTSRHALGAYDGDTIDLLFDLGFNLRVRHRVRLLDVNTPELRGETREEGVLFRDITRAWLRNAIERSSLEFPLTVLTTKSDSFGRYLGTIFREKDEVSLNQFLLNNGSPSYEKFR